MGAWEGTVDSCSRVNPEAFVELAPTEVARRAGSPAHLAGAFDPSGATIQPAILARGLRQACLAAGVRVYEHTPVRRFTRAAPAVVHTDTGTVTADRLVIATNAWSAGIPELRRHLVAISSDVVATDPMPDELARIGWTGGEAITDSQQMVDYYRTTLDGRIVFGKGGWGIAMGGRIPASFDRNEARSREVESDLHDAYPNLPDMRVAAHWSGPIDRSTDGLPMLGELGDHSHILHGVGWSGNGVGPSVAGGRSLAHRALGLDDTDRAVGPVESPGRQVPTRPAQIRRRPSGAGGGAPQGAGRAGRPAAEPPVRQALTARAGGSRRSLRVTLPPPLSSAPRPAPREIGCRACGRRFAGGTRPSWG